jgi:hypothetical protein
MDRSRVEGELSKFADAGKRRRTPGCEANKSEYLELVVSLLALMNRTRLMCRLLQAKSQNLD